MKYRPEIPRSGWYTYGLFLDGIPFYIGKGSGRRVLNHFQNSYKGSNTWKDSIIEKYGRDVEIIIISVHTMEKDAFEMERFLIQSYGFRTDGGTLVNFTCGGEGTSGIKVREEDALKRGKSRRKFTDDEFLVYLDLYFNSRVPMSKLTEDYDLSRDQLRRALSGETKTTRPLLEKFCMDNFGKPYPPRIRNNRAA